MRFKEIFEGNNSAFGQLILSGKKDARGKEKGRPWIRRETVSEQLWKDHVEGKTDANGKLLPALGVIPINEENKCRWGCIDIDIYNLDHKQLLQKIKELKFPLITFRSKSGGAHLFIFADKFIPAFLMKDKLEQMATALGYEGSEVFPKQTELLAERGDVGNFLNLPYHAGTKGLRYALDEDGGAASLESFYSMYDAFVQTEEQIDSIQIKEPPKKQEYFPDGPPCLNRFAEEGFGATKIYGVGYEEEQMPRLSALVRVTSQPPQWFLNVDDARIELKTVELRNPELFATAVLDQIDVVIPDVTPKNWRKLYLRELMASVDHSEPLQSLDPKYFIVNLLKDFTVNRPQGRKKEDILRKMAWTDEDNFCYFRMDDFYGWAKRNNWELDRQKTASLIKNLSNFEKEVRMKIKQQTPHVIKIKSMKIESDEEPEISEVKYEESPF